MDDQIDARIAALEAELLSLKQQIGSREQDHDAATSDRRGMVKLLAASAVGAVTGAALLGAQPAAAAQGGNAMLGVANTSTNATGFEASAESGVRAFGVPYGIEADGASANALFAGSGVSPVATAGNLGELYVDGDGNWWAATVASDTDALWRKVAGPGSAGQLHVLAKPVRVYDSRPGQQPTAVQPKAPTVGNTPRTIDTTANGSGVPPTANAVLVNLTVAGPTAPGFAAAWPSGPWPGTSSVNFATGQNIAATTVVGCGANATIQVQSNTVTDFLIDVIGYYQ